MEAAPDGAGNRAWDVSVKIILWRLISVRNRRRAPEALPCKDVESS